MNTNPETAPALEATLAIEGMRCGHCVAAVRHALGAVPGVAVARVVEAAGYAVLR